MHHLGLPVLCSLPLLLLRMAGTCRPQSALERVWLRHCCGVSTPALSTACRGAAEQLSEERPLVYSSLPYGRHPLLHGKHIYRTHEETSTSILSHCHACGRVSSCKCRTACEVCAAPRRVLGRRTWSRSGPCRQAVSGVGGGREDGDRYEDQKPPAADHRRQTIHLLRVVACN